MYLHPSKMAGFILFGPYPPFDLQKIYGSQGLYHPWYEPMYYEPWSYTDPSDVFANCYVPGYYNGLPNYNTSFLQPNSYGAFPGREPNGPDPLSNNGGSGYKPRSYSHLSGLSRNGYQPGDSGNRGSNSKPHHFGSPTSDGDRYLNLYDSGCYRPRAYLSNSSRRCYDPCGYNFNSGLSNPCGYPYLSGCGGSCYELPYSYGYPFSYGGSCYNPCGYNYPTSYGGRYCRPRGYTYISGYGGSCYDPYSAMCPYPYYTGRNRYFS
nr:PREDICTED: uncharacterized protein LOC107983356 [Anolis carolinensis]|eukprot:XP_016852286.1 PREDICTED: uncharacterized protein LOC107983356 [Anolis carolinensis]